MHMYNNAYMYDISIECDFDRPTKKKKKKNQHHIRFYITWIRGIQGTTENSKKKKSLINDSKYRNMSNNQSIRWYRGMFEHNEWPT